MTLKNDLIKKKSRKSYCIKIWIGSGRYKEAFYLVLQSRYQARELSTSPKPRSRRTRADGDSKVFQTTKFN